ncbi:MAG: hypothetical protein PHV62_07525 [Sulfuricurvum sp.]|nr:hypothetical protein [Sulfuricurvum sp.]
MIKIESNVYDISKFIDISSKQATFALSKTINDSLYSIKDDYIKSFETIFDKPNMRFLKTAFTIKKSTKTSLAGMIEVSPWDMGKGQTPEAVLLHHVIGGDRPLKKFEKAMIGSGFMGSNMIAVPAAGAKLDQYGNIKGSFSSMLISYFSAYRKAGFEGNMKQSTRDKMAKIGRTKKQAKKINGVMYFMSNGGKMAPGIWSKTGIHGSRVKPVILFVRTPNYKQRFDFYGIADKNIQTNFKDRYAKNFDFAMSTAK